MTEVFEAGKATPISASFGKIISEGGSPEEIPGTYQA